MSPSDLPQFYFVILVLSTYLPSNLQNAEGRKGQSTERVQPGINQALCLA